MSGTDDHVHRLLLEREQHGAEPDRRSTVLELVQATSPLLPVGEVERTVDRVLARVEGLGPLEPLLADTTISEIMVNGRGPVHIERGGRLESTGIALDASTVGHLIERIVAPLGRRVDRSSPTVDARLPDGSRVHVILPPLAIDGPCLTIRRFGARSVALSSFAHPGVVAFLRWAVEARLNILVSGGTGAGKTTLLNALAGCIGERERVVTIEDAAELRLPAPHVVRLEARPANAEGVGEVTIRELVRNALRMRPDRVVVGEIRGGEAVDMLQAMNTGHDGSLSTCHANTPVDALRRIETMALVGDVDLPLGALRQQLASALDLVVQVARDRSGNRRIVALDEVLAGGDGTTRALVRDGELRALPERDARDPEAPPPDSAWVHP